MGLLTPKPTPYDPLEWEGEAFAVRLRMACEAWALDGFGAPAVVFVGYALKIAAYVGVWLLLCARLPELGSPRELGQWWSEPAAFRLAIVWSMTFELLGLGCGSGPLTGRYMPPIGGPLYFLRPGTTKLPLFEGAPVIGAARRGALDVGLYAVTIVTAASALVWPETGATSLWLLVALIPCLGVLDKTLFLAARAEHFWVMLVCLMVTGAGTGTGAGGSEQAWIAATKVVALGLWFWAGVSKLNRHFPSVVCVMTSNNPLLAFAWLRRRLYRAYPEDLRPSTLAKLMAHAGTALELGVPLVLAFSPGGPSLVVGIVGMLLLHAYITSNVPMGVPLEWNVAVVYGGLVLFAAHPEVSAFEGLGPGLCAFLIAAVIGVPLAGNLFPGRVSFLLSMRYYAGNWPVSLWLFRGDSRRKLERLTKSAPWLEDQLAPFYDRSVFVGLLGKALAFRFMHLHGRALAGLLGRAVDDLEDTLVVEGELVAGLALGWNFGDGHLHDEQLLRAVQGQCEFDEGELRCIILESQPLGGRHQRWRIVDAVTGCIAEGSVEVAALEKGQPWEHLSFRSENDDSANSAA